MLTSLGWVLTKSDNDNLTMVRQPAQISNSYYEVFIMQK
jgi:hypothetical protein